MDLPDPTNTQQLWPALKLSKDTQARQVSPQGKPPPPEVGLPPQTMGVR